MTGRPPHPPNDASVDALAKALNQLRHEQFFNLNGLNGGPHSGIWDNLGEYQEDWRKAARRLVEILAEPHPVPGSLPKLPQAAFNLEKKPKAKRNEAS